MQSQWGEDGVIAEIFKRIGTTSKVCVEFGAWDGKYLSNVWNLWHDKGWSAVLIESEKERIEQVAKEYKEFTKVQAVAAFVEPTGKNSLDAILDRTIQDIVPDLVSIDIDSDDYYIFENFHKHLSRVIVIEYNPTIPPHIELVQAPGQYFGASALAQLKLAHKKGYKLAYLTTTNLILVQDKEFSKLGIKEVELTIDNFPKDTVTYVMTGYDGTPVLDKRPPYSFLGRQEDVGQDKTYQSRTPKIAKGDTENLVHVKIFKK